MSVSMKLYSFSKDENSTAQPTGGTSISGLLIEPCSILNPVIKLNGVTAYSYNYAYIQDFARYYFITDWETADGFWYIHCNVDPMASFKTAIGNSTQYVLRAAGAQNQYIVDTLYPSTGEMTGAVVELEQGMASYLPDGWFVLNITGSSQSTIGSYACDWHTFKNVINEMVLKYDDNNWWTNLTQGVRNSIWQPFKHLGNVIWFPDNYIDISGISPIHRLYLGNVYLDGTNIHDDEYDMSFYYLSQPSGFSSDLETLPKHPQAATYGKYMNLKPFTQYIYHDGVFGNIELDPTKLIDETEVRISKMTDPATGVQTLHLPDGQYRVSQVGVMIPMENNSLNIGGFLSSAAGAISGVITENPIAVAGSVLQMSNPLQTVVSSTSQMGSTVLTWDYSTITCFFWNAAGHDDTNKGKPYCQTKKINTLSGYILTDKAHISGSSMTATEQEMITSIMDSGFYYA